MGQRLAGGLRNEHRILDADAAPPRDVNARLVGDEHIGAQPVLAELRQARLFMYLKPETVPKSVSEILIQVIFPQNVARRLIHSNARHAGADGDECCLLRRQYGVVAFLLTLVRMSDA